ncbi:MAG: glycosyltransferase family 4 protein, partial [Nitrososphaera sp.]|nr:glycosyltransferase family 4 protein [Nitrososphaera sp.]
MIQTNRSKPHKIVWLVAGEEGYGVASTTLRMLAELKRRGWETPIVSLCGGSFVADCEQQGHTVLILNVGKVTVLRGGLFDRASDFIVNLKVQREATGNLIAAFKEIQPDAVHVRIPTLVGFAGCAAKAVGCPTFWQMPNCISDSYPLGINRWIYQWVCLRYGVTVIANSRFTAQTFGRFPVTPEVMHLGVDADRFSPKTVA